MTEYLKLKRSNCKNCYKCIRHCPVKAIKMVDNQAQIVSDECILCGQCFVVCPQNAKEIKNDVSLAKSLIAENPRVFVSLAPSFVANFPGCGIADMEIALKTLGFFATEETAIGATIVKNQYEQMVNSGKQAVIISSCCHSVNLLIRKYYPEALSALARVVSPMQAHCLDIKERHPEAKTVFIGPCLSKKSEAEQYPGLVDCVLTFEELSQWLNEENITIDQNQDCQEKSLARFFPTTGGVLKTMSCNNPDYTYLAIDGLENCIGVLQDIIDKRPQNCFIEMSACYGSCIHGPAMEKHHHLPVKDYIAVSKYAGREDFDVLPYSSDRLVKEHSFMGLHRKMPSASELSDILQQMGKIKAEDELNCGTCGYNTCRDKALAIFLGKATITMCLPYLKEKAESFSDNIIQNTPNGIIVLNENLEVQQINNSACLLFNIGHSSEILGSHVGQALDPRDFSVVLKTGRGIRNQRVFLEKYNKYVEQTITYDSSYKILICIMRDVTDEQVAKERKDELSSQTIEVTNKVIEKQMRVVQEIAMLLGETTAETKIALTKLKESLTHE